MNLQGGLFWTPTPNPLLDPYGTHFMHDSHQYNYHIVSCTATALSLNIHILFKGNPTSKRCVWMRRPNYHQIPCFQVFIIVKPFRLYQLYKFVHRSLWLRGSKCGLLVFPGIIYSTGLINERYLCACFTDCLIAFYVYQGSLLLTFFLDEKIIEKELQREKSFILLLSCQRLFF